jgi:hypothetical protein
VLDIPVLLQRSLSAGRAGFWSVLKDAESSFLTHILDGHLKFLIFFSRRNKAAAETCSKWVWGRSRLEKNRRWEKNRMNLLLQRTSKSSSLLSSWCSLARSVDTGIRQRSCCFAALAFLRGWKFLIFKSVGILIKMR